MTDVDYLKINLHFSLSFSVSQETWEDKAVP